MPSTKNPVVDPHSANQDIEPTGLRMSTSTGTTLPEVSSLTIDSSFEPFGKETSSKTEGTFRTSITKGMKSRLEETIDERNKRILGNRKILKWLPIRCSSDLVFGSWFFVVGSFLSALIPIAPLISAATTQWWPSTTVLTEDENVALFSLLVWLGSWYTISSCFFLRAVEHPQPEPFLANWYHFQTDELLAMWSLFTANFAALPASLIFVHAYSQVPGPRGGQFIGLSIVIGLGLLVNLWAVIQSYPRGVILEELQEREDPRQYVSPYVQKCCPSCCCIDIRFHLSNDWLILTWLMLSGFLLTLLGSIAALIYTLVSVEQSDVRARDVYNYACGSVDLFILFVGAVYFVAGSYAGHKMNNGMEAVRNV